MVAVRAKTFGAKNLSRAKVRSSLVQFRRPLAPQITLDPAKQRQQLEELRRRKERKQITTLKAIETSSKNHVSRTALDARLARSKDNRIFSKAELWTLFEAMHKGDTTAREKITKSIERMVVFNAQKMLGQGLAFEDLVAVGDVALKIAVDKYDWKQKTYFPKYAGSAIYRAMKKAIADFGRLQRVPEKSGVLLKKIANAKVELEERGEHVSIETVAKLLDKPKFVIRDLWESSLVNHSLDGPKYAGDELSRVEHTPEPVGHWERQANYHRRRTVEQFVDDLPGLVSQAPFSARDREIWVLRKGFGPSGVKLGRDVLAERYVNPATGKKITGQTVSNIEKEIDEWLLKRLEERGVNYAGGRIKHVFGKKRAK
ncbi:MAG: hypothetical protein WCW13_06725 [archaeon]|jgi:DNA-directed RNA polymerase sigma subunit (sigma70/sigma32)